MKKILPLVAALALTACVTINIYFPAAAAEKVADKIIDEVWQLQKEKDKDNKGSDAKAPKDSASQTKEKETK